MSVRTIILPCGRPKPKEKIKLSDRELKEAELKLRTYLAKKGQKYTAPRWNIAKTILKSGGHLDAGSLIKEVQKSYPSIGHATVYRNIKLLCEAGLLEESHSDSKGRALFEIPDDVHHDHILCKDCGEIFEFHNPKIEALQISIAEDHGFKLSDHKHVIFGSCEYLKKKS